jgi:hypothetical protein
MPEVLANAATSLLSRPPQQLALGTPAHTTAVRISVPGTVDDGLRHDPNIAIVIA